MARFLSRTDREVHEISGVGGMVKFGWPEYESEAVDAPKIIDVTAWRVRHTLHLVDVTHSGSYGGQKMAMTGRHWEAQLQLAWNSSAPLSSKPHSGFLETLLVGHQSAGYNVSVIFFLGDPLSYVDDNNNPRLSNKLYAPLALAQNIEYINNAGGKDIVRATASLQGNSKLEGWTGIGELLTKPKVF